MEPMINPSLPTHFGECIISPVSLKDRQTIYSPIDYRVGYVNNLSIPVTVEWRNGLRFSIPPTSAMGCNKFVIRVEINVRPDVKMDVQRILSAVGEDSSPELRVLRDAFHAQITENKYGGGLLILDYPMSIEQLQGYGGTVYYHELDTLISLVPAEQLEFHHPYSEAGRDQKLIELNVTSEEKAGFTYAVDLVDNLGRFGDRYLNIGNKVYRVPLKRDSTRRDGIYLISNLPAQGEFGGREIQTKYYPFSMCEELGLFRTAEEALNLGDMSLARKQQLADLEHQLLIEKKNLQLVEQQHQMEMAEITKEVKQLEIDRDARARELEEVRDRAELERQKIKDYYETRSYVRKDGSESLKMLPSIIVGLGAMFMAWRSVMA